MLTLLALLACAGEPVDPGLEASAPASLEGARLDAGRSAPNILVIIADDLGTEAMSCYPSHGVEQAPMPNLARLCRRGVVFDQAWSNPMSSPTRASMLTGRDAWRHGVGEPRSGYQPGLSSDEVALPELLSKLETGHTSGAFGKWHLADEDNGDTYHPTLVGFDRYAGALDGQVDDFYDWEKIVDGKSEGSTAYATTENVDDALHWVADQDQPWLLWLAFNAPHFPLHLPPGDLHGYTDLTGDDSDISDDPVSYFLAMVEAMDTEIGRLLDGLGKPALDNTWIVFVGDNGTWSTTNQDLYASSRSKGSVYTGGVQVPLVIVGPDLDSPGRRVGAMVSTTDIFATVVELAGADPADIAITGIEHDSVSMVPYLVDAEAEPQRRFNYSAVFGPTVTASHAAQAVTDGRYKLIRFLSGDEELYDLDADPREQDDLLASSSGLRAAAAYDHLSDLIDDRPIDTWWED